MPEDNRRAMRFRASRLPARTAILAASVFLMLTAGCHRGPVLAPADGVVTLDGKPLEAAGVLFMPVLKPPPQTNAPPAAAETDARGHFVLKTINDAGAVPGEYHIAITKIREVIKKVPVPQPIPSATPKAASRGVDKNKPSQITPEEEKANEEQKKLQARISEEEMVTVEWLIPEKYGSPEKSGLKATVVGGENHFELKLSSK